MLFSDCACGPIERFFASAVRRARAMRIRKRNSGSAATPALLSLIIVVMVAITVFVFASNFPWAVRPAPITAVGVEVDHQYDLTLAVTATVFVLSQLGLAYRRLPISRSWPESAFLARQQHHGIRLDHRDDRSFPRTRILMGHKAWAEVRFTPAAPDAIQVEVTGEPVRLQFPLSRSRRQIRQARAETDQRFHRQSAGH